MSTGTTYRYGWRCAHATLLLVSACGAKTGLRIPDVGFDAAEDAALDASRDVAADVRDVPCVPGRSVLRPASADVVFAIDRSGSMVFSLTQDAETTRDMWRWTLLGSALESAILSLDPRVLVAADFYPDIDNGRPEERCSALTTAIDIPFSSTSRNQILATFAGTPIGGTPTADSLLSARNYLLGRARGRRYIVLATDGAPNCNTNLNGRNCVCTQARASCLAANGARHCLDDIRTLQVVTQAAQSQIPTFVIGIDTVSRPEFRDTLDRVAVAGGRPRPPSADGRRYYSAGSPAELRAALAAIASTISQCAFESPTLPPNDDGVRLEFNGRAIPLDPNTGWFWSNRAAGEIELSASACATIGANVPEIVVDTCGG